MTRCLQVEDLALRMASTSGIAVRDRSGFFSTTKDCFSGEEAVEWLCQHGGLSRDEALTAGQELLKTGVFKCTSREQKFEANAKTLYQFQGSYADLRKQTLGNFSAVDIDGNQRQLSEFQGQVCLVVNVSSQCGLTPKMYPPLQQLYQKYQDQGFVVLGFPCNQFASQEPGTEAQIKEFVRTSYNVTFPMFAKINVNGSSTHPLFEWLKAEQPGVLFNTIKWNFTKFLIDRRGRPVARYGPNESPLAFEDAIVAELAKK